MNTLLNHYQTCLNDYTRPAIIHGQCQPEIIRWHTLAIVSCTFPGGDLAELVIPEHLQRILNIPTTAPMTAAQDINTGLMSLMLPGVLLSECERLGMRRLSNKLQSLFQQFRGPGIKERLTLLCWSELATGIDHNEWRELHRLSTESLISWTDQKLQTLWGLQPQIEDYVALNN
ncbi:TPA: malate transporter [Salmonella enterica]|uniref:Malate transporter n=1 Tax=Salmonella enterica subsp. enterica serovar Corvallis TaxID=593905 RepID=A0A8E7UYA1_SALET|nr:malate transporter [Salmonella enterica]EBF0720869.1 malate transporter [Salmonella enterica]EBQ6139014.1 malate transporter [Salmonella enterica subsp. enterica serovar Corvallis]EEA5366431.1 malate transporter [Salmonella enterica subsp. enterica serovar Corvallis]EEM6798463.1 malate transporter [Salmonella enterica subsp. enterica serovar Corvallis]QKW78833.1 malate transporter [Salmonella enterica]